MMMVSFCAISMMLGLNCTDLGPVEVRVAWNQTEYSVEEGTTVHVCTVQIHSSQVAFTVDINTPTSDGNFFPTSKKDLLS